MTMTARASAELPWETAAMYIDSIQTQIPLRKVTQSAQQFSEVPRHNWISDEDRQRIYGLLEQQYVFDQGFYQTSRTD